jgi:tRNA:m(5)U-54 methyltransferase
MKIRIIGGGLAGCEAAAVLARAGREVELYEMRPNKFTPAHKTANLAELVCSNSLKSEELTAAGGLLKAEMRILNSAILEAAEGARVPAGSALAVDRRIFSENVEKIISSFPNIKITREECVSLEPPVIVAAGPLASDRLTSEILKQTGGKYLGFYDAVAPIVTRESVDTGSAYYKSRYGKGGDEDYLNCPLTKEEYAAFHRELVGAETVILKDFEKGEVFEGCMPVEVLAKRGEDALRFGPMRPVGLKKDNGERPYAVVQLRREDKFGNLFNLVGFQTNLKFGEQKRVFGLIPALKNAEFARYGVMHRNTYLDSPRVLQKGLYLRSGVFFAGQITGVEGYIESASSGIISGINMLRYIEGKEPLLPPETTATGSLYAYISRAGKSFAPMHASFDLLPPLAEHIRNKEERKKAYAERALTDIREFASDL